MDYEVYGKIVCAALLHNNCIYMSYKGHWAIFPMEPIGVLRADFLVTRLDIFLIIIN